MALLRLFGRGAKPLFGFEVRALTWIATRSRPGVGVSVVRLLRRLREASAAAHALEAIGDRHPRSSRVHAERVRLARDQDRTVGAPIVRELLDGDLKGVDGASLVRDVVESGSPDARMAVWEAVETGVLKLSAAKRRTMGALVEVATLLDGDAPASAIATAAMESATAVRYVVDRVMVSRRWDVVDAIRGLVVDGNHALGDSAVSDVRLQLARALRNRGDFEATLQVLDEGSAAESPLDLTMRTAVEQEVALLRDGWNAGPMAPTTAHAGNRVGYLLHNSLPYTSGGYATRSHGILTGLVSHGWEVTGLTRPGYPFDRSEGRRAVDGVTETSEIDGVSYSRLLDAGPAHTLQARVAYHAQAVAARARKERWGVVHAASNHYNGLAAIEAARQLGLPSVYEVRGLWELTRLSREPEFGRTDRFALTARLEADAARLATRCFAITGAVRDLLVERGVPRDHIELLPNGVDAERFQPLQRDEGLAASLGLAGKTVVGYVGSIVDYEGIELIVDAVAELRGAGANVSFLLVGDGDALPAVRARVTERRVEDAVVITGRVPHEQVEAYYSIIDIAPFPRLALPVTEAVSPLKPFEAMAMAKPIVVSSVAALQEIVDDGVTGLVFDKGDAASLAAALARLVGNGGLRAQVGERARSWVEENRDWKTISGRLDIAYRDLGLRPH